MVRTTSEAEGPPAIRGARPMRPPTDPEGPLQHIPHPAAELFPLLPDDELAQLAADIAERGLIEPIVLDSDSRDALILDGRNRLRACQRAEVDPHFVVWSGQGGTPTAYVLSTNLRRRHVDKKARAFIAAAALPLLQKEAQGRQAATRFGSGPGINSRTADDGQKEERRARKEAADLSGVNERYVADAAKLEGLAPDLARDVKQDKRSMADAMKELKDRQNAAAPKRQPGERVPERKPDGHATHIARLIREADTFIGKVAEVRDRDGIPSRAIEALDESLEQFNDGRRGLARLLEAERAGGAA